MLLRGEPAFREMMALLEKMSPLSKFEVKKELSLTVPEDSKEWSNKDVIAKLVNSKKEELGNQFSNFSFHFDIGTSLADVSAVLQLVDDNVGFNGIRRKNIISESHKYVGVGFNKDKTKYCFYFLFAS
jgi:hypothetical protein